jgi:hypothetical protein
MKSEHAIYTGFEFEVEGHPAIAIINSDLKKLEDKSQYPYSVVIQIIPDSYNENGHPEVQEYDYLNGIEKQIIAYLEEQTRSVHVGHTTAYRTREIIFYTKDREVVSDFLEHFLAGIERENSFEVEPDETWENVAPFYDLI